MTDPKFRVKYCHPAPVSLRRWIDAHPDKVQEFDCGGGYSTDTPDGFAYDILLRAGWRKGDDFVHTLIEPTVKGMLTELKAVVECDCDECRELIAKAQS